MDCSGKELIITDSESVQLQPPPVGPVPVHMWTFLKSPKYVIFGIVERWRSQDPEDGLPHYREE